MSVRGTVENRCFFSGQQPPSTTPVTLRSQPHEADETERPTNKNCEELEVAKRTTEGSGHPKGPRITTTSPLEMRLADVQKKRQTSRVDAPRQRGVATDFQTEGSFGQCGAPRQVPCVPRTKQRPVMTRHTGAREDHDNPCRYQDVRNKVEPTEEAIFLNAERQVIKAPVQASHRVPGK